ncbi:N-acetylmuramoyl-L-alanine amidase [bacterium]|nr:N-acetylmuramoyl-L-alanine amidase [candidate division CSSED10-310 bacterium]
MDFKKIWFLFTLLVITPSLSAKTIVRKLDSKSAVIVYNRGIYFECKAENINDLASTFGNHINVSKDQMQTYKKNRGFAFRGDVYRFPYELLTCYGKQRAVHKLFPNDKLNSDGWTHRVTYTGSNGETLWRIASWFTGSGVNSSKIEKFNKINPSKLYKNQKIVIPTAYLMDCFKQTVDYPAVVGDLTFRKDNLGIYAEYKLTYGQTIYSDVVLRYTANVTAKDVLDAAEIILERSNLKSFHDIPADSLLKIPSTLISPQFLPKNDPRRIQYESTMEASAQYKKKTQLSSLKDVVIILDAGHGGIDPGAIGTGGEREDEYAYDVMCRVKKIIERETPAKVYTTIQDDETGYKPRNHAFLDFKEDKEKILTHPPYYIKDASIALNLRWLLANHLFDKHANGNDLAERIVFTSFHADSLHPKVNGLMIYVPGADYYKGYCKKTGSVYLSRNEVRQCNYIKLSRKEKLKAEGFSNTLAEKIIRSCRQNDIPVHANQPIRRYITRKRSTYVPAVLKYCKVPARILIEIANMNNSGDRKRLRDPKFREKIAEMYVETLVNYFTESPTD